MTVSPTKNSNHAVNTLNFVNNPPTLDSTTNTLAVNTLNTPNKELKKAFTPLSTRVQKSDYKFFSSPNLTAEQLSRAIKVASKLDDTKFQCFLRDKKSLIELKSAYQNSLDLLLEKNPDVFQKTPKISNFVQCGKSLELPCIEWVDCASKEDFHKACFDFINQSKPSLDLKNYFESFEEMKSVFNHLRQFLIDPIPHEIGRNFCVTRMLWVSFFLERILGFECLECLLLPNKDYFYLNKQLFDSDLTLELEKYLTSLNSKEDVDQVCQDNSAFQASLSNEEKVFFWNYHAAVLVMCKIDGKHEQPYVFDLIALEPVKFDLWKQGFQGRVSLRPNCKMTNMLRSDPKSLQIFDLEAKENQWKQNWEIQLATLKTLSASYQSALKGIKSEALFLKTPFC